MRLWLSAQNGRELEFLTETAAENRRFISLDIDFYISNLPTTGQGNYSWERMINRYIHNGTWLLEIFSKYDLLFFFVRGNSKFRGSSVIHSPVLHPELIPG